MATAKKSTKTTESQLKDLDKRVKVLEEKQLHLPSKKDMEKHTKSLEGWVKKNPVGALAIVLLVGLVVGAILS